MAEKMEIVVDKTYELLTLMYNTMLEQFAGLKHDMVRMEFELKEQMTVLHDGISECNRKIDINTQAIEKNTESIDRLSMSVTRLETVVENQEV